MRTIGEGLHDWLQTVHGVEAQDNRLLGLPAWTVSVLEPPSWHKGNLKQSLGGVGVLQVWSQQLDSDLSTRGVVLVVVQTAWLSWQRAPPADLCTRRLTRGFAFLYSSPECRQAGGKNSSQQLAEVVVKTSRVLVIPEHRGTSGYTALVMDSRAVQEAGKMARGEGNIAATSETKPSTELRVCPTASS